MRPSTSKRRFRATITNPTSSPPSRRSTHDVFISFRGVDVRNTFVDHLHSTLGRKRVIGFRDDDNMDDSNVGENVDQRILRAIEDSSSYVVVLTRNYGSSAWCLDELVHIMRCSRHNWGRRSRIFPIFYHVTPEDVSSGCYEDDFDQHKRRYTYERVDGWLRALAWIVGISGWVVTSGQYVQSMPVCHVCLNLFCLHLATIGINSIHLDIDIYSEK
ncbi:unnamed protein product [Linum tenue]|uniref:ADP-ribosyl cyclase/cyclic ADP-ribose hydrolase n=1 Tax=Linum tenue TaxID=586396 RepID=A0AAV0R0P5_9ROSI|nr:unnamed protein product [Linum tenue]